MCGNDYAFPLSPPHDPRGPAAVLLLPPNSGDASKKEMLTPRKHLSRRARPLLRVYSVFRVTRLSVIRILIVVLAVSSASCFRQDSGPMIPWKGMGDSNDVVFIFKNNATRDEITAFSNTVLHKPNIPGYGMAHQDGIGDLMVGGMPGAREGGCVNFSRNATAEQKAKLIDAIRASPVVYKVYENAVPDEVGVL